MIWFVQWSQKLFSKASVFTGCLLQGHIGAYLARLQVDLSDLRYFQVWLIVQFFRLALPTLPTQRIVPVTVTLHPHATGPVWRWQPNSRQNLVRGSLVSRSWAFGFSTTTSVQTAVKLICCQAFGMNWGLPLWESCAPTACQNRSKSSKHGSNEWIAQIVFQQNGEQPCRFSQ